MSGKGSNRRRENREAIEANWPTTWDARDGEAERERIFMAAVTNADGSVIPFHGADDIDAMWEDAAKHSAGEPHRFNRIGAVDG